MLGRLATGVWKAACAAHDGLSLLPPYKRGLALAADRILGPAEDFEYVGSTAPSSPPPTIS